MTSEVLSQVLLLIVEESHRDQVSKGSRKKPHPNPFPGNESIVPELGSIVPVYHLRLLPDTSLIVASECF